MHELNEEDKDTAIIKKSGEYFPTFEIILLGFVIGIIVVRLFFWN